MVMRDAELRSPMSQANTQINLWGQPSFFNLGTPNFKQGHIQTGKNTHVTFLTFQRVTPIACHCQATRVAQSPAAACCFPPTRLPETTA